jgi:hypothetical protein
MQIVHLHKYVVALSVASGAEARQARPAKKSTNIIFWLWQYRLRNYLKDFLLKGKGFYRSKVDNKKEIG